jgi:precorrin-6B methylase 1
VSASIALPDITIVGAGLLAARQLGAAADDVLRAARVVFCSTSNTGIADYVRLLNPFAAVHVSEQNEYRVGMFRPDMYRRIAQAVLDAARVGPGVVMLAPGSAVVVDAVTQHILDKADGLSVQIMPGISSIESVLAEVGYDVAGGLTVVLAQNLVLRRLQVNPAIASIVLQPAYYDTLFCAGAPRSAAGRFAALEEQLARTFSSDAAMALVIAPTEVNGSASVFWFRLGALGCLHGVLSPRHTLFIPPELPPTEDAVFAARIASWDACVRLVDVDERGALRQMGRRDVDGRSLAGEVPPDLQHESDTLAERWRLRRG